MRMSAPITFAILAGGAATRLGGRDKGLQLLGDRPLVAWVIRAVLQMDFAGAAAAAMLDLPESRLQEDIAAAAAAATKARAGIGLLIVANRHLEDYARYALTLADDVPGFRGPLAGIATALAACPTPWLLTVPVDCPEPPHDLALRLVQAAMENEAGAVVVHDGERRQPLFALYRRELAASAATAVDAEQGVWQWQASTGARELDFRDRRQQFRNLNTPEDFATYADRIDA